MGGSCVVRVAVADLLHDVLPVDSCINRETIRAHVFETAERLEKRSSGRSSSPMTPGAKTRSRPVPSLGDRSRWGLDGG